VIRSYPSTAVRRLISSTYSKHREPEKLLYKNFVKILRNVGAENIKTGLQINNILTHGID
jgi:hypothetical protein